MKENLIEFGLSSKEATIYLICLKTGEATANRIADIAHLPRSTAYDILEKLRHRGFITTVVKKKKMHFAANQPEIILNILEERKKEAVRQITKKEGLIKEILPKLKSVRNVITKKATAEVFEGVTSVSKILDEIADTATSLSIIGSQENAVKRIGYRTDRFRARRLERGFKVRQILEYSKESKSEKKGRLTQVRYLKSVGKSKEATFIYNNVTVHLILSDEITAIRIKSKEYTNARRIIFDELWNKSKR